MDTLDWLKKKATTAAVAMAGAATSNAAPSIDKEPASVLFLHGYGESGLLAGMSTKDLKDVCRLKGHDLLNIPDGFKQLKSEAECGPIADDEYRKMVMDGDLDAFCWYQVSKDGIGGHRKAGFADFAYRAKKADADAAVLQLVQLITELDGVDAI